MIGGRENDSNEKPTHQSNQKAKAKELVGWYGWCGLLVWLGNPVVSFCSSLSFFSRPLCVCVSRSFVDFGDKKQKNSDAIAPCVVVSEAFKWRRSAASVGNVHTNGITPALALIAEAKPVWARSVLPWVTRWESRVMLLSFFFLLQQPSLFLLSFLFFLISSHTHTFVA